MTRRTIVLPTAIQSHLIRADADHVRQFGHHQVDALQRRLLQSGYLLLDDGLERHVGSEQTHSDTVDVADGERDLSSQLLLVELHLHDLEREAFVEQTVYLRAARQLHRVDLCRTGALYCTLEVCLQLLDHPGDAQKKSQSVLGLPTGILDIKNTKKII
jgi:hypothetical protein